MTMASCTLFCLQRFSTEDGPGIRTTVFFKGCPLTCPWCHNPEGLSPRPEIMWKRVTCLGCGDCVKVCPLNTIQQNRGTISIDRSNCDACGLCVEECPSNSLEKVGDEYQLDQLVDEVLKDRTFFSTSGGGVTLSGGEPLLQQQFVVQFARLCHEAGLHVALDTSGFTKREWFGPVLNWVDLLLFDLKTLDPEKHKQFTNVPLELVLSNLEKASKKRIPIWVRTPIVPGYTADKNNLRDIACYLKENIPTLERYDLLAFSNMCSAKYQMLERPFALADEQLLTSETMQSLTETVRAAGIDVVQWSGPTRLLEKPETA
ncbi:MAG: glycyl-radical enzyme activating protein [Deltaproteobacteria bacterium]|nr:glycyl-radical enzyme activating protein [Deltaproteobacteria bacterium]